jgi:cyclophilin family peptidyl-prolyl cis-trans isomerase
MKNIFVLLFITSSFLAAQTGTSSTPKPTPKPATTHRAATAKPTAQAAPAGNPKAVMQTTAGDLTCELFPKQAPKTVQNFIGLATGTKDWTNPDTHKKEHGVPLYNGTIFHRVIPNFMIQGGDPQGTGQGGPGYSFEDEFSPDLKFDVPGRLAMANSGPGTNGSQFFITEVPTPWLDGHHTIFGQCTPESVELVKQMARKAADPRDNRPYDAVKINKIEITGLPKSAGTTAKKPSTTHKTTVAPKKPAPKQQ